MQILGIDPAPSKKSTVYDGEKFHHLKASELRKFLIPFQQKHTLICWDAPLTGPADLDEGSFSMREIEKVLAAEIRHSKAQGVSVLPYSGCSHWAISRSILGLPIVGKYDKPEIPFPLTYSCDFTGPAAVEVHPAVAMYYWLGEKFVKYKGSAPKSEKQIAVKQNFNLLMAIPALKQFYSGEEISSDDELDSLVAYMLGSLWINKAGVTLLGDEKTGAMLLPEGLKLSGINFENDKIKKTKTILSAP